MYRTRKEEQLLLNLNEFVSDRLCYELGLTAISQKLLFKNLINLVHEFNGNLDINVLLDSRPLPTASNT